MEQKRRLQELGGSLYLSLPASWLQKFNVKKGSHIYITLEDSGALTIFPEKVAKDETTKEKTSTILYNKYIFRNIMGAYLIGNDYIVIKKELPFTRKERNEILAIVHNLLNVEVIEEQPRKIVIQNLKSELDIKKLVTRMYQLTKTMLEDIIPNQDDKEILQSVIDRDKLVGKCYLAIIMQIRASLTRSWSKDISFVEIFDIRLLIERMEKIGDEIKHLAKEMLEKNKPKHDDLDDLKELLALYEQAYGAYLKKDISTAEKFWDNEEKYKKQFNHNAHLQTMYELIKDITDLVV
ncbi:phosphate uptake regulator PhoU [Candidatus Woesearchaeota archaeon]|nr:phosphate uptake regulator PhoU [Candidatus Woesearchaeota archaeon]